MCALLGRRALEAREVGVDAPLGRGGLALFAGAGHCLLVVLLDGGGERRNLRGGALGVMVAGAEPVGAQ
jgi:hypothetical protein